MTYSPLLPPVVALVAWTLLIMLWMAATRLPAMKKAGINVGTLVGGRGQNLEGVIPDKVQWKSHNYSHLLEQPTIFYAIVLASAMMGLDQPLNVYLAWGYVGLRIVHSLIQCTVNTVRYRFLTFLLASLCLLAITVDAALRVIHDCLAAM